MIIPDGIEHAGAGTYSDVFIVASEPMRPRVVSCCGFPGGFPLGLDPVSHRHAIIGGRGWQGPPPSMHRVVSILQRPHAQ